jgi:hypothetical protein
MPLFDTRRTAVRRLVIRRARVQVPAAPPIEFMQKLAADEVHG